MGNVSKEPSMDAILSSIKRIISEDDAGGADADASASERPPARRSRVNNSAGASASSDEVLELTEEIGEKKMSAHTSEGDRAMAGQEQLPSSPAARVAGSGVDLHALSDMLVVEEGAENTLDGLIRSILTPLLREWLAARLPSIVEELVAKEIARITH